MTGTAPQTITSTPTRLDVGVLNGTHGWLKIRAELGAGGAVHASVTAIDAAHESLRSALPEIASYLSVEAVKVKSIEVHRFADSPGTLIDAGAKGQTDDDHQGGGQGTTRQSGVPVPTVADSTADDSPLDAGGVTISGLSSSAPVGGWVTNLSSATPGLTWRGGFAGSGVWLDVCA